MQIGLSGAAIIDPLKQTQGPALGQFLNLYAVALLLALNAHLVMLDALAASLQHVPVGSAIDMPAGVARSSRSARRCSRSAFGSRRRSSRSCSSATSRSRC